MVGDGSDHSLSDVYFAVDDLVKADDHEEWSKRKLNLGCGAKQR